MGDSFLDRLAGLMVSDITVLIIIAKFPLRTMLPKLLNNV